MYLLGVIRMEKMIGSLTPGKCADIIVIDMDQPHLTPMYDPVSHLVYSARGSDVRDVLVNGSIVVRDRRMATIDEAEVKERSRSLASRVSNNLGMRQDYGVFFK